MKHYESAEPLPYGMFPVTVTEPKHPIPIAQVTRSVAESYATVQKFNPNWHLFNVVA